MILLTTPRLILSSPNLADLSALEDFERRNLDHLRNWESPGHLPAKERLILWIKEWEEKKSARFFIKPKGDPTQIIGFCNFTQIFYGPFQACYLGYKIDWEYEGKGLMFEALEVSIAYVFETLELHRIMANYMPANLRSARLLQRLGFTIEGFAKNYLLINGRWEDHVLTALNKEEWRKNL